MSNLPTGWRELSLEDIFDSYESGSRPKGGVRGISEGVPSIGGEHLDYTGRFNFSNIKYVPFEFAARINKGRIQANDILIVKDGATTGKTAIVDDRFPFDFAVANEHVFVCRVKKQYFPKYVFRFLLSTEGQKRILENFQGSAQGGINKSFASGTIIPIPHAFEKQIEIVEKLELLLGKIDITKERLKKIPTILKRFRQSVLIAACSGKLTVDWREKNDINFEMEWKDEKLGDLIDNGPQNGLYKPQSAYGSGDLIVRIDNFYDGRINDWNTLKKLQLEENEIKLYGLANDDILINRVNSIQYLGKSALVRNLEKVCVFESNMMRIRLNCNAHPEYIVKYLNSYRGLNELRKNAKHAVNQASINQGDVKDVTVPLPPLPEQEEIVSQVDKLFALAEKIEQRYKNAKAQLEQAEKAIYAKAFCGELVKQENDEVI